MRSTIGSAAERLRDHDVLVEIVKTKLRDMARSFEGLSEMARGHADSATRAAMGLEGPPTPEFSRRETWADRPRLLERAAALGELAGAIRCELSILRRRR